MDCKYKECLEWIIDANMLGVGKDGSNYPVCNVKECKQCDACRIEMNAIYTYIMELLERTTDFWGNPYQNNWELVWSVEDE